MNQSEKFFPFSEGIPTKPDVDLLLSSWPALKMGDTINYEEIEKLIGVHKRSSRFHTVTAAWRDRLLESKIVVECLRSVAFFVADAGQVSSGTHGKIKTAGRMVTKHAKKLFVSRSDDPMMQARLEHNLKVCSAVKDSLRSARRDLLPPPAATSMPRINPPQGG